MTERARAGIDGGLERGRRHAPDYKSEYQRRLQRGAAQGFTRSQARGHARANEPSVKRAPAKSDDRLEAALRALRETGSQTIAAKNVGVSPERFRRFLRENQLAERQGRRWLITDDRPRGLLVISQGREIWITAAGFASASLAMKHRAAVRAFLETNDPSWLTPFDGRSVIDVAGRAHPLETRPNTLYRLAAAGSEGFEQVYRLIV